MVVTSCYLWVILCPTSYETPSLPVVLPFREVPTACLGRVCQGWSEQLCCNLAGLSSVAGWAWLHPADKRVAGSLPGQENSFHNVKTVDYITSFNLTSSYQWLKHKLFIVSQGSTFVAREFIKPLFSFIYKYPLFFLGGRMIRRNIPAWHVWGMQSSSFQSVIVALSLRCCQRSNIPDV